MAYGRDKLNMFERSYPKYNMLIISFEYSCDTKLCVTFFDSKEYLNEKCQLSRGITDGNRLLSRTILFKRAEEGST